MIEVANLRVVRGKKTVVEHANFHVRKGEIFGLLGHNGSGKSTIIKTMLGLVPLAEGVCSWDGQPIAPSFYNKIGYVPEERALYLNLTVEENLRIFSALKGVSKRVLADFVKVWDADFGIKELYKRKCFNLSKGQSQKVQILIALAHDPDLLILDEPFSGLDVVTAQKLSGLIELLRAKGKTIILSTHQIDEAEKLCDGVCFLREGRVMYAGPKSDLQADAAVLEATFVTTVPDALRAQYPQEANGRVLRLKSLHADLAKRLAAEILSQHQASSLYIGPKPLKVIYEEIYR